MGPAETVDYAREFLQNEDYVKGLLGAANPRTFENTLEYTTEALSAYLPRGHWGSARKFLNIFLRDCFYNSYLRKHYKLSERWGSFLEVPLDRQVANRLFNDWINLRRQANQLPQWAGVVNLTEVNSEIYQAAAKEIAEKKYSFHRVHLDLVYWGN